jgi:hypothetical protein
MRNLRMLVALWALTLPLWPSVATLAQKPNPDTQVPIHATVVSVDRTAGTVVLRYTRAGSQPATKHAFTLGNRNDALRLRPGAVIDGTADFTQATWSLTNINVESDKPIHGQTSP